MGERDELVRALQESGMAQAERADHAEQLACALAFDLGREAEELRAARFAVEVWQRDAADAQAETDAALARAEKAEREHIAFRARVEENEFAYMKEAIVLRRSAEKAEREIEDAFAAAVLRGVPRADRTLSRLVSDMGHDLLSSRAAVRDANDVMTSLRDGRDRARADAERLAAAAREAREWLLHHGADGAGRDDEPGLTVLRVTLGGALAAHEEDGHGT